MNCFIGHVFGHQQKLVNSSHHNRFQFILLNHHVMNIIKHTSSSIYILISKNYVLVIIQAWNFDSKAIIKCYCLSVNGCFCLNKSLKIVLICEKSIELHRESFSDIFLCSSISELLQLHPINECVVTFLTFTRNGLLVKNKNHEIRNFIGIKIK